MISLCIVDFYQHKDTDKTHVVLSKRELIIYLQGMDRTALHLIEKVYEGFMCAP